MHSLICRRKLPQRNIHRAQSALCTRRLTLSWVATHCDSARMLVQAAGHLECGKTVLVSEDGKQVVAKGVTHVLRPVGIWALSGHQTLDSKALHSATRLRIGIWGSIFRILYGLCFYRTRQIPEVMTSRGLTQLRVCFHRRQSKHIMLAPEMAKFGVAFHAVVRTLSYTSCRSM